MKSTTNKQEIALIKEEKKLCKARKLIEDIRDQLNEQIDHKDPHRQDTILFREVDYLTTSCNCIDDTLCYLSGEED